MAASIVESWKQRAGQLGIALAIKMIPSEVLCECRMKSRAVMAEGKPTNWIAAAVILAIWLLIAAFAIALVVRMI